MGQSILRWLRISYQKTTTSIAFIPAVIALCFLLLSVGLIYIDFSETGKHIKSNLSWLSLKDASTARSIISAVVSGTISLTVFSFSMVMILLNQAASQMSNRILDKLIGNRFQQTVLGFYIGTIVYALFLLSTIRDINSGIYVPAISTYLLIALTVVDIFLFIYFLHYITQSVKYETIIHKIYTNTKRSLEKSCTVKSGGENLIVHSEGQALKAPKSGIFQGFQQEALVALCKKENIAISFLYPAGAFLMENNPYLLVINDKDDRSEDFEKKLNLVINIHGGQDINLNFYYGFRQLTEVAIKALSPGINDPGTAILSLQALGDLLAYRLTHYPEPYLKDQEDTLRIIRKERSFDDLFRECILPVWDYGKNDRLVQQEMLHLLTQLNRQDPDEPAVGQLLQSVQDTITQREASFLSNQGGC